MEAITQQMKRQFWKYNLNPITGLPKIIMKPKQGDAQSFMHPHDKLIKLHA